ncbi:hypothetical protein [Hugenholtzia roseola]|uniref:hypothetical protein n=1 Tax=Hugenholtzia roseola TaxID=1002 RepID=UPI0004166B0D|nr:hypothetical protein [Hugenholtzia roseola]
MTTITELKRPNWYLAIGIPLLIAISSFCITQTEAFSNNAELLSQAILVDMLLLAPFLYYLVIRKSTAGKHTLLRLWLLSLLVLELILGNQAGENLTAWQYVKTFVYPLLEIGLLLWLGYSFYVARKELKTQQVDFPNLTRQMLGKIMGQSKATNFVAAEIICLYYVFAWEKKAKPNYQTSFSTYQESGGIGLLYGLLFILLVETLVLHLLLAQWNPTVAWVATGLSLYACLQIFAHTRAIKMRPIVLDTNNLQIYNGLAAEAIFSYDKIEKVELSNETPSDKKAIKMVLLPDLETHNCAIFLKEEVAVSKFFGIKQKTNLLLFYTDRPQDFLHQLALRKAQIL